MDQEALDALTQVPLFAGLSADELMELTRQASLRTYRKNTLLMEKGDEASVLYVILSGSVKVFSADNKGKEIVLNELGPRDLVGEPMPLS
jgi:CRP/FNR family cyclic AMP-dependent transcriptional regulator